MTAQNGFLPDSYEAPSSGGFTDLVIGDNKFRILGPPLLVWVNWNGGKCTRTLYYGPDGKITEKPAKGPAEKDSVKHGWCLKVFNYATEQMEILELTQVGIITALTKHAKDPVWGDPKAYDVIIDKKGSGMETKYGFRAQPHQPVTQAIMNAYEAAPIELQQLLIENGNPFLQSAGTPASTNSAAAQAKVVTPDNWAPGDLPPAGFKVNATGNALEASGKPF